MADCAHEYAAPAGANPWLATDIRQVAIRCGKCGYMPGIGPRVDLDLLTRAVVYLCDKEGCCDAFDSSSESWQEEFPEKCPTKFTKVEWAFLRRIAHGEGF